MFEFIILIAGKVIASARTAELGLSGSRDTTLPDSKAEFLNSVTANKQTVAKFHLAGSSILSHPKKKKSGLLAEHVASLGMRCDDNEGN